MFTESNLACYICDHVFRNDRPVLYSAAAREEEHQHYCFLHSLALWLYAPNPYYSLLSFARLFTGAFLLRFWATSECRINRASIIDMSGGASDGIDVNQSPTSH
jgi:hypothetical protein